ncbi:MAG: alpha/beta fold hydrolase [Clostridia bacterium]|nr:alpha/beta fold hydrolase [Clostridia bacterium]
MIFYNMVRKTFRDTIYTRTDDTGCIFYFTASDFPGLHTQPKSIKSSRGYDLKGFFYFYDNPIPGRIIVFEHGMGSGHTGYMKEIEQLCRHGFKVFAYDHSGCMASGGETTGGFAQSICDCNDVLDALSKDACCDGCTFSVIGHSWGGLSTLNIAAFHPEVTHCVAISGPISVKQMLSGAFSGILKPFRNRILQEEIDANPVYATCDARLSLSNTNAHVLVLHSDDDPVVPCKAHFEVLRDALEEKGKKNIRFEKVTKKAHNPNYTEDAVQYKDAFFAEYKKAIKEKKLVTAEQKTAFRASYDWNRMTQQDEAVWKIIFETLDKQEDSHAI